MSENDQQDPQDLKPQDTPDNPVWKALFGESESMFNPVDTPAVETEKVDEALREEMGLAPSEGSEPEDPKPEVPVSKGTKEGTPKVKVRKKTSAKKESEDAQLYDLPSIPSRSPARPQSLVEEDPIVLDDDRREEVDMAKFAERSLGEKYQGLSRKVLSYYKEHDTFVSQLKARLKADGEEFSTRDPEYQAWVDEHKPVLTPTQRKEIAKAMIRDEVIREVRPEIDEVKSVIKDHEVSPRIRQIVEDFELSALDALPEDYGRTAESLTAAAEENPMEWNLIQNSLNAGRDLIHELARVLLNPKPTDGKTEKHKFLEDWSLRQARVFYEKGGPHRIREGKKFVPMDTFFGLPENQRAGYWTFSGDDLIRLMKENTVIMLKRRVDAHRKTLEKSGYVRAGKQEAKPAEKVKVGQTPKNDVKSVRVSSSPQPPASAGTVSTKISKFLGY